MSVLVFLSGSVCQDTGCTVRECISGHWLYCQGVYIRTLGVRVGGALCHSVTGGPFRRALPTKRRALPTKSAGEQGMAIASSSGQSIAGCLRFRNLLLSFCQ